MDRYGEHVTGFYHMGGFQDFYVVEANLPGFDQAGGKGPVFDHAGEPQPFIQALAQVLFPVIWALRALSTAKGEFGSIGFSGRGLGSSRGRSLPWFLG